MARSAAPRFVENLEERAVVRALVNHELLQK